MRIMKSRAIGGLEYLYCFTVERSDRPASLSTQTLLPSRRCDPLLLIPETRPPRRASFRVELPGPRISQSPLRWTFLGMGRSIGHHQLFEPLALVAQCFDVHPLTEQERVHYASAIPLDNHFHPEQSCAPLRQVRS